MLNKMKNNKTLLLALVLIGFLIVGLAGYWIINNKNSSNVASENEPTLADQGLEEDREQSQSINEPSTVEDTEGEDSKPSNSGFVSDEGTITLFSPKSDQLVNDKLTISGEADTSSVQYRIIDHERGMIAQGQLNVVDGKFSGNISNLNPSADTGAVEVYTVNTNTSVQLDSVEVSVRFES